MEAQWVIIYTLCRQRARKFQEFFVYPIESNKIFLFQEVGGCAEEKIELSW